MKKTIIIPLFAVAAAATYGVLPTYAEKLKKRIQSPPRGERLFLTFDDGPSAYTPEILSVLKENQVKATFFMVADFAEANPEIVRMVKNDGHVIGMHSKAHKSALIRLPAEQRCDLRQGCKIMNFFASPIKFFRPPWGHFNLALIDEAKKLGLTTVLWDVMAEDWEETATPEKICNKLLKRVQSGSIICLHDGRGAPGAPGRTAAALRKALPMLKKRGFKFCTIDEYYE